MGKIGDLWVKLGLKKDEYSKGMKQAGNEATGFLGKLKSLKAGAVAVWAAIGTSVTKFAKDAISMTNKWGDAWQATMAGIKGAYASFVRQISSGEGWDHLFANMREAYRVSKEVAEALDEIFERKTSFSYQEAEAEKYIAEQNRIMRDQSKTDAERKQAAQNIIDKERELGDVKKAIWADEAAAHRRLFLQQSGLNDEQTDFLVKEYNQNREVINQAREYLKTKQELSKVGSGNDFFTNSVGPIPTPVATGDFMSPELKKLEAETPQYIKDVAELTRRYDKVNDDLVKGMADAEVAVLRIDTDVINASQRANSLLGTLNKAGGAGGDAGRDQAEKVLQRASDAAKSEIQILDEKYDAEKALLEQYGMDTEALLQEYLGNVADLIVNELSNELEGLEPVEFEPLEIVPPDLTEWDAFYEKFQADQERMQDLLKMFRDAVIEGFSAGVQEFTDQLMGLSDVNPGKIVQALLTPLADMAIKEGEILIAQGIGVEACKEALESLNGYAAIAAGTALVAIGAAAKSGLQALARNGAGSTATTTYGGSTGANDLQTIQTELTVYVTGRISGNDILLSGQKTQNALNR